MLLCFLPGSARLPDWYDFLFLASDLFTLVKDWFFHFLILGVLCAGLSHQRPIMHKKALQQTFQIHITCRGCGRHCGPLLWQCLIHQYMHHLVATWQGAARAICVPRSRFSSRSMLPCRYIPYIPSQQNYRNGLSGLQQSVSTTWLLD